MPDDWKLLSHAADLKIVADAIELKFADGRAQLVQVEPHDGGYRLWSKVAPPSVLRAVRDHRCRILTRNRYTDLVGFRVEPSGWLIGETWPPTAGLTAREWRQYVEAVARASDRFEHALTGQDVR